MPAGAEAEKGTGGWGEMKCYFSDFRAPLFLVVLWCGLCLGWILSKPAHTHPADFPACRFRVSALASELPLY